MNVGIYSFAHETLNKEISFYQKQVFDKMKLPIIQVISSARHPKVLETIIRQSKNDYIIFFDIDCIPLTPDFFPIICNQIKDHGILSGAIQCANHLDKMRPYVAPCFCGFSKRLYEQCGNPSLSEWERGDVMQKFTDECIRFNKSINYWMITDSGDSIWSLSSHNLRYGHGTIYENMIYHQFQIRFENQQELFTKKCQELLRS
jgi:hypothetical protein